MMLNNSSSVGRMVVVVVLFLFVVVVVLKTDAVGADDTRIYDTIVVGGGWSGSATAPRLLEENDVADDTKIYDTIIVGGGWSGLATARRLLEDNEIVVAPSVLLLEARDYLGGRSRTQVGALHPSIPTELGSAWIYQGTAVADQFNEIGLAWTPNFFSSSTQGLYDTESGGGGGRIPPDVADNLRRTVIEGDFVPYLNANSSPNLSLEQLIEQYFEDRGQSLSRQDRQLVLAMANSAVHSEYTSALNETQSSYVAGDFSWDYRIDFVGVPNGGFGNAVNHYAGPLFQQPETSVVKLQTKVTEIDYDFRYVGNDDGAEYSIVRITALDLVTQIPTVYYARTAVCTVPLGVLKFGDIQFRPNLPTEKSTAIDQIGMGNANKCYLYWDAQQYGADFINSWWPRGQLDFQLITPDDESSYDWTYFINDHDSFSDTDYYVLSAWTGGSAADRWEQQPDNVTVAKVMENLQAMLGGPAGVTIPPPSKTLITRWRSDPFARGAYTFHAVGVDMDSARQALARPSGNLFWAGEATLDGMTTVVAYQSGRRAARQLLSSGLLNGELPPIPAVPTSAPTASPKDVLVPAPTFTPTEQPVFSPTSIPTNLPVPDPVPVPTPAPVTPTTAPVPTEQPVVSPTSIPTTVPVPDPVPVPTSLPVTPTAVPVQTPTNAPTTLVTPSPVMATPLPTVATTPVDPCETDSASFQSCFVGYPDLASACRKCLDDFGVGYASQSFTAETQCQSIGLSCQVFVPTCRNVCEADNPETGQKCWPVVHAYNACLVSQVCSSLDMGQCPLDYDAFMAQQSKTSETNSLPGRIRSSGFEKNKLRGPNRGPT